MISSSRFKDTDMKILHILRTEPEQMVQLFIDALSREGENREIRLYEDPVDYDQLIIEIFENQKVVSWW